MYSFMYSGNQNMPPQITCTTWQNAETRKSHISLYWIVLHTQCTCALSSWKKKLLSLMCLIVSNICWGSKMSHSLSIHFYSRLDEEQLPQRLTAWQTWLTQTMSVTDTRTLCSLPKSCLVLPLDRFDSDGWFSSNQVIFLTVFRAFWWKNMQHLSEKTQFPGFLFPQVVQKH